jgi:hypothetical protein
MGKGDGMTKTEVIAHQALRIAKLEQEIDKLRGEPQKCEDSHVAVYDGLKLCDWHGAAVAQLKPGTNVRVNREGNPHYPFVIARVRDVKMEERGLIVDIDLQVPSKVQEIA